MSDVIIREAKLEDVKDLVDIYAYYVKDTAIISQALDGGADDFVMRPFDEDIIASKLKLALINTKG